MTSKVWWMQFVYVLRYGWFSGEVYGELKVGSIRKL